MSSGNGSGASEKDAINAVGLLEVMLDGRIGIDANSNANAKSVSRDGEGKEVWKERDLLDLCLDAIDRMRACPCVALCRPARCAGLSSIRKQERPALGLAAMASEEDNCLWCKCKMAVLLRQSLTCTASVPQISVCPTTNTTLFTFTSRVAYLYSDSACHGCISRPSVQYIESIHRFRESTTWIVASINMIPLPV